MAEPVSLPPGSDNPPDQAREPFTEEDVELIAPLIAKRRYGNGIPAPTNEIDRIHSRIILRALAEAGRLLPAGVRIERQYGIQWREMGFREYVSPRATLQAALDDVAAEAVDPDSALDYMRPVSRWHSRWEVAE